MTFKKVHIIESIAEHIGFTKNHSSEIVETLIELIKRTLESGEDVLISNFGKFCVKEKKASRWRHHASGEYQMLPPKRLVKFRCSRKLRDKINNH
jgi:integration host factor subunit alpha